MKRKIALGMIFVILSYCIISSATAARPTSSLFTQSHSVCECGCDSFTLHCSEVEIYSKGQHPLMLGGYSKTCEYNIHSVYTIAKCTRCGSRTVAGLHEHGESDHTYPFICGGVNERICSLDGQVYSITPVDELTPVYEPIE